MAHDIDRQLGDPPVVPVFLNELDECPVVLCDRLARLGSSMMSDNCEGD